MNQRFNRGTPFFFFFCQVSDEVVLWAELYALTPSTSEHDGFGDRDFKEVITVK